MQSLIKNSIIPRIWLGIIKLANHKNFILFLWVLLALVISLKHAVGATSNNYLIFKYVFLHAKEHLNLYIPYPEYGDTNHYGPFFSLVIAPFAILPDYFGMLLWQLANVLFLYYAVKQLPLKKTRIIAIYLIITHELLTAMFSLQFNISITAIIILAFVYIKKEKNFWAAFVIAFGTFVKLYGIVGLAFFFFAKDKMKLIAYCIFWGMVFLVLPMLFFSPQYILQCYHDWYVSLSEKELLNASLTSRQDISIMGMTRRIIGDASIPNYPFLIVGIILFFIPYLRLKEYKSEIFKLTYLASTLIFTVIFSNSSESPTYIIAFAGVAIWFMIQDRPVNPWFIALLIFAIILTSLSPSDLIPKYLKVNYIIPYNLKALPCILIWIVITYQLIFKKFSLTPQQAI